MAYIKVNHQQMLNVADTIDDYVLILNNKMNDIDTTVISLDADWSGEDYQRIKQEWFEIYAPGSTTDNMRASLQGYASVIRQASKEYKEAQARAINRANSLC